jgi:glycosyltransferase involved in cell wall biosynthesis
MSSPKDRLINVGALFGLGTEHLGGCEIYRISMPFNRLNKIGKWACSWMPTSVIPTLGTRLLDFDIIVLPRMWASNSNITKMMSNPYVGEMVKRGMVSADSISPLVDMLHYYGKKVIYEVDDDFTNRHRVVHGGGDVAIRIAKSCDAIITSTSHLQKVMAEATGRPTFLCRNYIEPEIWENASFERTISGTTIGITGSATHKEDWAVLETVLPGILSRHPDVNLIVGGYCPDWIDQSNHQVYVIPPLPYTQYTGTIRAMDILLIPVVPDDGFNLSKSPIKAIEGMAAKRLVGGRPAGAAVIATDMEVYRDAVSTGYNGVLVKHTPLAWEEAIEQMISDQKSREKMQITGNKWVKKNRSIHTGWRDWHKAFTSILAS